jgi:cytochrome c-type biogenesis protein CcmH
MIFWTIVAIMTLAVAGSIALPLLRARDIAASNPDVDLYRAQLAEIDRDLDRNLLDPDEAERSRTEIARRLLAANKMTQAPVAMMRTYPVLAIALVAVLGGISFVTYGLLGRPGYGDVPLHARLDASEQMRATRPAQAMLELLAPPPPPVDLPQDYVDAIAQLRVLAPTLPDDLEAWQRLAFHEAELRNYAAAARAQERVITLLGDDLRVSDQARLMDLLVVAAGGLVSPEAETLIRAILARDDSHVGARYYLGALYNQTDRPDLAYRFWRDIAENGDPANFHVASARAFIEDAAFRAGVDYSLPLVRGPSAADIAASQDMSPEDRQQMIGGMVAGLAERLANEGGTAADWARLITAYSVLGDADNARAIWVEAADVFGANAAAMDVLRAAAQAAGLIP